MFLPPIMKILKFVKDMGKLLVGDQKEIREVSALYLMLFSPIIL